MQADTANMKQSLPLRFTVARSTSVARPGASISNGRSETSREM